MRFSLLSDIRSDIRQDIMQYMYAIYRDVIVSAVKYKERARL